MSKKEKILGVGNMTICSQPTNKTYFYEKGYYENRTEILRGCKNGHWATKVEVATSKEGVFSKMRRSNIPNVFYEEVVKNKMPLYNFSEKEEMAKYCVLF